MLTQSRWKSNRSQTAQRGITIQGKQLVAADTFPVTGICLPNARWIVHCRDPVVQSITQHCLPPSSKRSHFATKVESKKACAQLRHRVLLPVAKPEMF